VLWIAAQVGITALWVFDFVSDLQTDRTPGHLALDVVLGLVSSVAVILFARTLAFQRIRHLDEVKGRRHRMQLMQAAADESRAQLAKIRQGLTAEMDRQFSEWGLSPSETDVARFLVKGLSLKEIAEVRGCSERTARHQALAIYQKAGISGRAELAAYFLEEWLAEGSSAKSQLTDSTTNLV